MDGITSPHLVALAAGVIGLVCGFAVHRSDWCAMGAVADVVLMGDWRRARSWLLAIATAIIGTHALILSGALPPIETPQLHSEIRFLAAIAGGLGFGFGMTLTGGCISKNLVRLGGGSLRALVVLMVVAVTALATMAGPLPWLQQLPAGGALDPAAGSSAEDPLLGLEGVGATSMALLIAAMITWFCLHDRRFRASRPLLIAGLTLGLLVPLSWLATSQLAHPPEDIAAASLNYVFATTSSLIFLTTGGGTGIVFGAALVAGTVIGALVAAITANRFRLEGFADGHDLARNLGGAAAMGIGGALAGGCTIGQGLTGISTLGLTSILVVASIVLGAMIGVRTLEAGGVRGALRALAGG